MPNVYVTTIFDSDGNNVTGSFNQKDFTITSSNPNPNKAHGIKNATLNFSQDNSIPYVYVNPSEKQPIFGKPEEMFSWLYYAAYSTFTIDGVTPRNKGGKRNYLAPQGIVVDEETNEYYVSFNLGDVPTEVQYGGPQHVSLAGVPNEYINLLPIIKFNSAGVALGIEYIVGGTHEGYMTLWNDKKSGKKYLGVAAYPHGVGTRNNDKKPDGFNDSWTSSYYIGDDNATYYWFDLKNKFTSTDRSGNDLLHDATYNPEGALLTKLFDTSSLGAKQNSEMHIDPYRNIILADAVDSPNTFRYSPLADDKTIAPINYLNLQDVHQGTQNTYQSSCIRGGHFYASYGNHNSSVAKAELRVSLITNGLHSENNQSLSDYKVFTDEEVPNFYETEGMWVNEAETYAWFIVKYYNHDNNQLSTMRVFRTPLSW